jgi:hypothetical protein
MSVLPFESRCALEKETEVKFELDDKNQKHYEYIENLNESLLSEVQQLRSVENKLRGQLWEAKQKIKQLQQNS